ncbi:hypothetical protein CPI83_30055 (plasmid) [Rhodococcus sp. H-CA8f]|uniref:GNAT family N-acetyltransferase n=1 Tax=Rhodococcus sp. H-CA8f TaxID=1727214 RepID=UPI000BE3F43A|nr:GNAT family N-acetyltransferase [Rhodococcus sp. H-CA8f]ATI36442.1 hypothetical protein CPI83_30055 [Rhodococcus sp. H-CA8f]
MATPIDAEAIIGELESDYPGTKVGIRIAPIGELVFDKIIVPAGQRSSGTGTAIMERLIGIADANYLRVTLTPSGDYGGSVTRLRPFYKRFGFVENSGRNKDFETKQTMLRDPITN